MKSNYGMVFYPENHKFVPENRDALLVSLQSEGFIGDFFLVNENQQDEQSGYLIGEEFLKLITFLGCSPQIQVTPPKTISEWGNFCYIEIQQFGKPRYFKGLNQPKCSCPQCKSRVTRALPSMAEWLPGIQQVICPKCGQVTLTENLNWRHGAGFGQLFIVVHSIYPNEAVPTDKLMRLLLSASNQTMNYFYFES